MRVTVRYLAQLKQAAGTAAEEVHVDDPCTAADLVLGLAQGRGDRFQRLVVDAGGGLHPTVLVFVGEEQVPPGAEHRLRDGDVVTLLLPIAGGAAQPGACIRLPHGPPGFTRSPGFHPGLRLLRPHPGANGFEPPEGVEEP